MRSAEFASSKSRTQVALTCFGDGYYTYYYTDSEPNSANGNLMDLRGTWDFHRQAVLSILRISLHKAVSTSRPVSGFGSYRALSSESVRSTASQDERQEVLDPALIVFGTASEMQGSYLRCR